MMDLSGYDLETLRDSGEFVLFRARTGNAAPVLIPSGRLCLWHLLDIMGTRRWCSMAAAVSPSSSFSADRSS
jgi:hypothetical protein